MDFYILIPWNTQTRRRQDSFKNSILEIHIFLVCLKLATNIREISPTHKQHIPVTEKSPNS